MRVLLVSVVLAAALTAQAQVGDPLADFAALKSRKTAIEAAGKTKYVEIKQNANGLVAAEETVLGEKVGEAVANIEKTETEITSFREGATAESAALAEEATKGFEKMNAEDVDITTQMTDVAQLVSDKDNEYETEQTAASSANMKEYEDALAVHAADIASVSEETKDSLDATVEESNKAMGDIGTNIGEVNAEDKKTYEEVYDLQKKIAKVNTDTNRAIASMEDEYTGLSVKAKNLAETTVPRFQAQAKQENDAAMKVIQGVTQDSKNDIHDIQKEEEAAAESIFDENADKAKDFRLTIKESTNDLKANAMEQKKDDRSITMEGATSLIDAEDATLMADQKSTALAEEADGFEADGDKALQDAKDLSDSSYSKMREEISKAEAKGEEELQAGINEMKFEVNTDITATSDDVNDAVDNDIQSLGTQVRDGTSSIEKEVDSLETESNTLGKNILLDSASLTKFTADLGDDVGLLKESAVATSQSLLDTGEETLNKLTDMKTKLAEKITAAAVKLEGETTETKAKIGVLATDNYNNLESHVAQLRTDATAALDTSAKSIQLATAQANEAIGDMQKNSASIISLKAALDGKVAPAQKQVEEGLDKVAGSVQGAQTELASARQASLAESTAEETRTKAAATQSLADSRVKLTGQLSSSSASMDEVLNSVALSVEDLKKQTQDDFSKGVAFQDDVRRELEKQLNQVEEETAEADKVGMQMSDKLRSTTNAVSLAKNAQARDGQILTRTVVADLQRATTEAETLADEAVNAAKKGADTQLSNTEKESLDDLKLAADEVTKEVSENLLHIATAKNNVRNLETELKSAKWAADVKEKESNAKITELQKAQESLAKKAAESEEAQRKMLEDQKTEINADMKKRLAEEAAAQAKHIKNLEAVSQQQFEDAETQQAIVKAQEQGKIDEVTSKINQQSTSLTDGVDKQKAELTELQTREDGMATHLKNETEVIEAELDASEAELKAKAEEEVKNAGGAGNGEVGMVEELMDGFGAAKDKADAELKELDGEFKAKVDELKNKGDAEAAALKQGVDELLANAPDLMAEFIAQTKSADGLLQGSHDQIDHVASWTKQVVYGFEEKIRQVAQNREDKAKESHTKIGEMKREIADQAEVGANMVAFADERAKNTVNELEDQLDTFEDKLKTLVATGARPEHEQAALDTMDNKLFDLMSTHNQMMSWKGRFKATTGAWRDEVDSHLRKLRMGTRAEGTDLENERLEQEMQNQKEMRDMQLRVEGEIADNSHQQSREFAGIAAGMSGSIDAISNNQKLEDEKKAAAAAAVEEQMKAKTEEQDGALGAVADVQSQNDNKAAQLEAAANGAATEMDAMFMIPAMDKNAYNQKTNAKIDAVNLKIAQIGYGSSLLEESESNLRKESQSTESGADETAEIKALQALNTELYKQNQDIAKSNEKLAKGVQNGKQKLESLGLSTEIA